MRRLLPLLVALPLVVWIVPNAGAKSYSLTEAQYTMRVASDGAANVTEKLNFNFSGDFHGAYRDIPIPSGASIDSIKVSDPNGRFTRGGTAELGVNGPDHTFETSDDGSRLRIVWHFNAAYESRVFVVKYRWRGVAKVYDDVVDLNVRTWGDQWPVGLERLDAQIILPGHVSTSNNAYRAWGMPYTLDGVVTREPDRVTNEVTDIPSEQYAELRVVFPRSLLASATAAKTVAGDGLTTIVKQQSDDFQEYSHDQAKVKDYEDHPEKIVLIGFLGGLLPVSIFVLILFLVYGRGGNPNIEYVREPPSDLSPAVASGLITEDSVTASGEQLLAVVFDLIQRGFFSSLAVPAADGEGSDLMIKAPTTPLDRSVLKDFEMTVATLLDDALIESGGAVRLADLPQVLKGLSGVQSAYSDFQSEVTTEASSLQRLTGTGNAIRWGVLVLMFLATLGCGAVFYQGLKSQYFHWNDLLWTLGGLCTAIWVVVLAFTPRSVFVRRAQQDRKAAAEWSAFRRFLNDFPRMQEVPSIGLPMWERLLVYGIGFGLADKVVEAARINLGESVWNESSLYGGFGYWSGGMFYWGSGAAFSLGSDLNTALTPETNAGGIGGSMGGMGGGGFGGGGGGAW